MKKLLKKFVQPLVPQSVINTYHYFEAKVASQKAGNPSEQMIVIGIVGSKGKTTTANMLWSILSADGTKVGLIGTANIRYGDKEELNKYHMTMPGAFIMQKILKRMAELNCKYVIMEVPSEGQAQYRHIGINYDILVFTNVTKELMAAHNFSLETLHKHNKRVFKKLYSSKRKSIDTREIPKLIIANCDNKYATDYLAFPADQKVTFGTKNSADFKLSQIKDTSSGISFRINNHSFMVNILGKVNAINAAGAIATALSLGINESTIEKGLAKLPIIPGRMEVINQGQPFTVIVDYAHEQASMTALTQSAKDIKQPKSKTIILLGAEGGGRDVAKRPEMGKIVARNCDEIILSNVDPYDDDPMSIIEDIARGAERAGAKRGRNLHLISDRHEGIKFALRLAKPGDLVLITGKGAEQSIVINGKSSPWDDRMVVREELKSLGYNKKANATH
jgi:UDP-N-acetylmuramoyl-L-alanyl-D-glutamate--2,6-diaminopimelate ligase